MTQLPRPWAIVARACLLAFAIAGVASPSWAKTIQVTERYPAKFAEAGTLRKLAVSGFTGRGASDFAGALVTELTSVQLDGRPYFTILSAQQRSSPQMTGRAVGADGVLTGDVRLDIQDSAYDGIVLGCTAKDANGGCAKLGLVQAACARRTIAVTVNVRLVRVTDARIVYSASKSKNQNISWCSEQGPNKTIDAMLADAFKPMVADIRGDISPYAKTIRLKIKDDRKGLPKDLAARFSDATRAAGNDLDTACASWVQIDAAVPNHPATVYDLGVCEEAVGDLAKAAELYGEAQKILRPGDRDVSDALTRVQGLIDAQQMLARQEQARQEAEAEAARQAAAAEKEQRLQAAAERSRQAAEAAAARKRQAAQAAAARAEREAQRSAVVAKYGAGAADAILAGQVKKGMTPQQVVAAKGQPAKREPITAGNEQWYYPGARIIFTNGRVSYVGS